MPSEAYVHTVMQTVQIETAKQTVLLTEIRDLLRAQQSATHPPIDERLIDACNTLAIDNIISAGRARELSGQPIMEQRAWFRAHKEEIESESDRETVAILRVRPSAGEPSGGEQAGLRSGSEDGNRASGEPRDNGRASQALGSEGLLRSSTDQARRGVTASASPPPIDTAQGREAGETLADVLRQAMEAHNWKSAPHEMKLRGDDVRIASAVARARDRQTVAMLRREVESETNGDCRAALLWAADRIESGAVDEGD